MAYTKAGFTVKNGVATIEMNAPDTLNPLDLKMAQDLSKAFETCEQHEDVKVIVLTGAGRVFSGGGDIRYMMDEVEAGNFDIGPLVRTLTALTQRLRQYSKPVLCAVQGAAAGGGCNLALACDMIYAEEKAQFMQAFVNIGLTPDTGGAYILPRLIGRTRAFELFATGRPLSAPEMYDLGLITKVTKNGEVLEETMKMAEKLAAGPSLVYKGIKELLWQSSFPDFDAFMMSEAAIQVRSTKSDDFVEGIRAFLEKRPARFKGK